MGRSPGHQNWPNHKVREEHLDQPIRVEVNGEVVAQSGDVIKVDEDKHPPRYYFPRSDVALTQLTRTETRTQCPFKGTAHHFSVEAGGKLLKDTAWTYEDPYEEHAALKDRIAFYDNEFPEISIEPRP